MEFLIWEALISLGLSSLQPELVIGTGKLDFGIEFGLRFIGLVEPKGDFLSNCLGISLYKLDNLWVGSSLVESLDTTEGSEHISLCVGVRFHA